MQGPLAIGRLIFHGPHHEGDPFPQVLHDFERFPLHLRQKSLKCHQGSALDGPCLEKGITIFQMPWRRTPGFGSPTWHTEVQIRISGDNRESAYPMAV
jgi:hypothetical protein